MRKDASQGKNLGCCQYVLFASGYDTFAIRNGDPSLSVFELDRPGMLEDKRERIRNAGLTSSAVYVPCDFSRANWAEKLVSSGFRIEEKAFGSLLGFCHYLTCEEFEFFLRTVALLWTEGSALCFDYPTAGESAENSQIRSLAFGAGEEMKKRYTRREIEFLLDQCGFRVEDHLEPQQTTDRICTAYNRANPLHPIEAPEECALLLAVRTEKKTLKLCGSDSRA